MESQQKRLSQRPTNKPAPEEQLQPPHDTEEQLENPSCSSTPEAKLSNSTMQGQKLRKRTERGKPPEKREIAKQAVQVPLPPTEIEGTLAEENLLTLVEGSRGEDDPMIS